jgi:hypothetical protein
VNKHLVSKRISPREFERLPLRAHEFLAGIPLHDAWVVELPRTRAGITLDQFLNFFDDCAFTPSPLVRQLLRLRFFIGRFFGWDRERSAGGRKTFATRLTPDDRARSLVPAGTQSGPFRVVYRFENEEVAEIVNATAHAAAVTALVETATAYRYYFAVYVERVSRLTPLYMALIDPFRRFLVYPSLLRSVRTSFDRLRMTLEE